MKLIKPFRGLRPCRELAARVAAPPYDVLSRQEAYELAKDNPHSFLHVNRPEVDLPLATGPYDPAVYAKGAENLQRFVEEGVLQRDRGDCYYIYCQVMGWHEQTGLVAAASVDAYEQGLIKKHEHTRPEKEDDRVKHMDALGAQVGPVFLTYKADTGVDDIINEVTSVPQEYDFTAEDGVHHLLWTVDDPYYIERIDEEFSRVSCLYVADGHHRSAAAQRVRELYRQRRGAVHTGSEPYNHFLAVLFPHDQVQILDYNRLVADLNGCGNWEFLDLLKQRFDVRSGYRKEARPRTPGEFGLCLEGRWYLLTPKPGTRPAPDPNDPVASLDINILQREIFAPLLNIQDQRTDNRVDFVGGIRGYEELEERVIEGPWEAAFTLHPVTIEQLMAVADANMVMPPKSTWFEPKLRSGLVIHPLD